MKAIKDLMNATHSINSKTGEMKLTTKAQAIKNLKKAAEDYYKTVRLPVTIEFQKEHIPVILKALECYQRMKFGQFDYAIDEAFGWKLDHDARQEIHNCARKHLFPEFGGNPNVSYGIYNQEKVGDATMAYEIYKVLTRYRAITNNDGWSDWGRSFDKPFSHTGVPLPEVQGFIDYKLFKIPKRLWKKIDATLDPDYAGDWRKIWESIDKAMPNLPKGEKSEIYNDFGEWYVKVTAPIKPNEEEK
jgi:hypothetical protein